MGVRGSVGFGATRESGSDPISVYQILKEKKKKKKTNFRHWSTQILVSEPQNFDKEKDTKIKDFYMKLIQIAEDQQALENGKQNKKFKSRSYFKAMQLFW